MRTIYARVPLKPCPLCGASVTASEETKIYDPGEYAGDPATVVGLRFDAECQSCWLHLDVVYRNKYDLVSGDGVRKLMEKNIRDFFEGRECLWNREGVAE